jgi:hypothetical protein
MSYTIVKYPLKRSGFLGASLAFIAGYEDELYGNFAGLPNLMHMLTLAFLVQSSNKCALRL